MVPLVCVCVCVWYVVRCHGPARPHPSPPPSVPSLAGPPLPADRTVFESLDIAWGLLRGFQKESLKKLPKAVLEAFYSRADALRNGGTIKEQ